MQLLIKLDDVAGCQELWVKPVAKYFRKRTEGGEVILHITRTAYSHLFKGFEFVVTYEVPEFNLGVIR
ncbi:hypothetical protein Bca4012_081148 [Brassica carinata]